MAKTRKISLLKVSEVPNLFTATTEATSLDDLMTPGIWVVVPTTEDLPEWFKDKYGLVRVTGRYTSMLYMELYNSSTVVGYRQYSAGKWLPWKQIPAPLAPATTSE